MTEPVTEREEDMVLASVSGFASTIRRTCDLLVMGAIEPETADAALERAEDLASRLYGLLGMLRQRREGNDG